MTGVFYQLFPDSFNKNTKKSLTMKNEIKTTITSLKSNDEICIKIVVTSNSCANLIVCVNDKACIIYLISTDV